MENAVETARSRPPFTSEEAMHVARTQWGLEPESASALAGDRDRNFSLKTPRGRYVIKFIHPEEAPAFTALQQRAMRRGSGGDGLRIPRPVPTPEGLMDQRVTGPDGVSYRVVVNTWVLGGAFAQFKPHTERLLASVGRGLAELDGVLADLEDAVAARRRFDWDVRHATDIVRRRITQIHDADQRALVQRHMDRFIEAAPSWEGLPLQTIHGDANDYNLLVDPEDTGAPVGLIDFGDMVYSWRVAELGIAAAYLAMGKPDPVAAAMALAAGYHAISPLADAELAALPHLVAARLCISVCHSAERSRTEADDPYQTVSQAGAWELLARLDVIHPRLFSYRLRQACGLEPCRGGATLRTWLAASSPEPVMTLDPDAPVFDLSVGTTEFDGGLDPTDASIWEEPFKRRMNASQMAFGRYMEPRICYRAGQFLVGGSGPERQRTIHLGVDIFAPAGTSVATPYDASVVAVVDNNQPLDYGPTVVLGHTAGGQEFWTLYGHLARGVTETLRVGDSLSAGEVFATLGTAEENGGWPPHLHFQVYADAFDEPGNLPGVAFASQQAVWASISPNPDLVLRTGLPLAYSGSDQEEMHARRREHLAPNLSLSYEQPLHIVRGLGPYLFDERGRAYLDCVNNVCHVGHAHPAVVRAAARQLSVLNTNTRYLHRNILDYSEALCATLPDGLDVCFLVNSGSEANDLALRLARAATGRTGTVVLEGGYHGNLSSLIEISPYKFDGPGGAGAGVRVEKAAMPDAYRSPHRSASDFAAEVVRAASALQERGEAPAAFIAEAILSCGGQIVPPDGYLQLAYDYARRHGALCVADEVQTGFGRVGQAMWAFELQGVVPDIVTMGKPIGNGFPLGAVVTTRAVADAFANGMEYFNTYGGNPVSAAVGLAVLEIIESEGLMARAARVGGELKAGLSRLADRHPIIGHVRGQGLFLGFELIRDPDTLEPAADEATHLVNRMRDLGVLLSTDGPLHNVIKIKPPLAFSEVEACELLNKLAVVLEDHRLQLVST